MLKAIKLSGVLAATLLLGACADSVTIKSANFFGSTINVYGVLNKPDGKGPFPAIVLLHGSGGLHAHETESWPRYLNGLGYVTLSPDTGVRGVAGRNWDIAEQAADAYGALDALAKLPFVDSNRVGVIGFSAGGRTINQYVHGSPRLRSETGLSFSAAVSFYGHCSLINFEQKGGVPLMMIVGDHETSNRLYDCLGDHPGTEVELHILKDAYHAFDFDTITTLRASKRAGNLMLYNPEATTKSEELVKAFLAKHLGK